MPATVLIPRSANVIAAYATEQANNMLNTPYLGTKILGRTRPGIEAAFRIDTWARAQRYKQLYCVAKNK